MGNRHFNRNNRGNWFRKKKAKQTTPSASAYPPDKPGEEWYMVHTDGSALGNPGPGGYGVVVRLGETCVEMSKGYKLTTNNRMEMMSVIALLEEFGPNKRFKVHTDSSYTMDGMLYWMKGWKARGWLTKVGEPVKNKDLWQQLDELMKENEIQLYKVKAHSGIPDNERCDVIAKEAAGNPTEIDAEYEKQAITVRVY